MGRELAHEFCVQRTSGKAAGKSIDVATAIVRSCVTLLSSEDRSEAYLVSGLANASTSAIARHGF